MSHPLIPAVLELVKEAGQAILPYWKTAIHITQKTDHSPVTIADATAHQHLVDGLAKLTPDIPILSEEACNLDVATRKQWQRWWLIDPLDGTKEFIAEREDFTVNVALIEHGQVIFGVVGVPVTNHYYWGGKQWGAWQQQAGKQSSIHVTTVKHAALRLVASHRHSSTQQQSFITELSKLIPIDMQSIGSSLKFCLIANGQADCYPRFAPTSQWDSAAAQGVLEGAGGTVIDLKEQPLNYTMRESYLNPFFIALGDITWQDTYLAIIQAKHLT